MQATQPRLSFWQIWNVSFGFLGVQFGFALQNANVSRILSDLGADLHSLSLFWLVAPIMGLIVQPIVGSASDRNVESIRSTPPVHSRWCNRRSIGYDFTAQCADICCLLGTYGNGRVNGCTYGRVV